MSTEQLSTEPDDTPPPTATNTPMSTATSKPVPAMPCTAPERAETQCIVSHAAAPAQVCREDVGMHSYYCIGLDGKGYPGPGLHAVATYAAIYPKGYGMGGFEIYHSNSPGSGKEVVIH